MKNSSSEKSIENHVKVFEKALKKESPEIEYEKSYWGVLAKHDECMYRIVSYGEMRTRMIELLTLKYEAEIHIELDWIIEIAEGVHREYAFYEALNLSEKDDELFFKIFDISDRYDNSDEVFWKQIDSKANHLLGELMCAVAKVWDLDSCADELQEIMIHNEAFLEIQGGLNEVVTLDEETENADVFFIFQVDEGFD
jgi:hypothetical protein